MFDILRRQIYKLARSDGPSPRYRFGTEPYYNMIDDL